MTKPWLRHLGPLWLMPATLSVLACTAAARAEERGWLLEIGPAAEWSLQGDTPNYGANIAVEREVIDKWFETELGMSALWTSGHGELSWDLLFKKSFTLSPIVELMIGVGPSFSQPLNSDFGTVSVTNPPVSLLAKLLGQT